MKWKVFSIFDQAAGVYQRPFPCYTEGEASRAFGDLLRKPDHPVAQHAEDYSLMLVSEFEDTTGEFKPLVPKCVMTGLVALSLVRQVDERQNWLPGMEGEKNA